MDAKQFVDKAIKEANEQLYENGWSSSVELEDWSETSSGGVCIEFNIYYKGEEYSDSIIVDNITKNDIEDAGYSIKESAAAYEDNSDEYDEYFDDDDYEDWD